VGRWRCLVPVLLLAAAARLLARDWPDPAAVMDPLLAARPGSLGGSSQAFVEYNYQAFESSYDDLFQISALSSFAVAGPKAGLAVAYSSYLMNGAVQPGDSPGSRLQWMMNAVQFEYGIFAALRVGDIDLLADYSRTSQHPFRDQYSQVASDLLRAGALGRMEPAPGLEIQVALHGAYSDLFAFWQSPLPRPRAAFVVTPRTWLQQSIATTTVGGAQLALSAFAEGELDWVFLRAGGQGANVSGRTGARAALGGLVVDLYLDGYASDDSEIRVDRATPVGLLGWGFRLETAPPARR
jgi:hypothetical protein